MKKLYKRRMGFVALMLSLAMYCNAQIEIINPATASFTSATINPLADLKANIHFVKDDKALDYIKNTGFTGVRMDCPWAWIESTPGVYDFSSMDTLMAGLTKRGLKAHLIFDYGTTIYPNCNPPSTSTAYTDYTKYCKAVVKHFLGKGVTYEIWNEPNLSKFWSPVSGGDYAALVKVAGPAISKLDPSAIVCSAGLSGVDTDYVEDFLAGGGGSAVNSIGLHPYRTSPPEIYLDTDIQRTRAIIKKYVPSNTPAVRFTEWGYSSATYGKGTSSGPREIQAKFMVRSILAAWMLNIPSAVCYDVKDDGSNVTYNEDNFGLLDTLYNEKPAGAYVRTLIHMVKRKTFMGVLNTTTPDLHALRFDSAGITTIVLWVADSLEWFHGIDLSGYVSPVYVDFTQKPLSINDASGVTQSIPTSIGGFYKINPTFDPLYIRFKNVTTAITAPESDNSVAVFPNPSSGTFTFSFSHPELVSGAQLIIYNQLGQCMYNETLKQVQGDYTINLSNYTAGFYFYRIASTQGELISEGKLVIEK